MSDSESDTDLPPAASMHTTVEEDEPSEPAAGDAETHHRRILRGQRTYEILREAILAYATEQLLPRGDAQRMAQELRTYIDEEMACDCERLACTHLAALVYVSADGSELDADGSIDRSAASPSGFPTDPMTAYLAQRRALNYAFFHYGTLDVAQARAAADALMECFVRLNRDVRHDWTGRSIFVSPINENAGVDLELPNPNFTPVPTSAGALLHQPKRARVETPTVAQHVELSAVNDDARVVQLAFFHEFRRMVDFAESIEAHVTERVRCDWDPERNTIGWMAGLFRSHNAARIIIPMQENIHAAFIYPGDIRHMAVTLHYDDLSLVAPGVVASTIASDTYADVAAQLVGNLPRLWDAMATVGAVPDAGKEAVLAWDVRAGVLLHHFYLLHVTYLERKADDAVLPISIYTLRRSFGSTAFSPARFANKLLLFRRCTYLCRADGTVACFSGYHAMEHGLRAWASYLYGEQSQLVRVLSMVHVPTVQVPDEPVRGTASDLPAPQTHLSEQTTHVPNSAYASSMPQGSIFATGMG